MFDRNLKDSHLLPS